MTMTFNLMIAAAVLAQAAGSEPIIARAGDTAPRRMHVGDTGIRCTKLPCPSRGIFVPGSAQSDVRSTLLMADLDGRTPPPPMIGDEADLTAIRKAWDARDCLAIDGRLISGEEDKPVLRVDRVVGLCQDVAR